MAWVWNNGLRALSDVLFRASARVVLDGGRRGYSIDIYVDNCQGIRDYKVIFGFLVNFGFFLLNHKHLYISNSLKSIIMNHDEPGFEKKLQKFSVVQKCPRCKKLSLSYQNNKIYCPDCGYEEQAPALR